MSAASVSSLLRGMIAERNYDSTDQLYGALPAVYRELDGDRDLLRYLAAFGTVLDQVRKTLDQRLHDISPHTCQEWLLPYFADLLDVNPVSPDVEGKREEIARAVNWRQRKGTVSVCVEIAEAVGQAPVIGIEGARSVARTPLPGYRQRELWELGEDGYWNEPASPTPSLLAQRPGTPAVTVDFRHRSQPRRTDDATPESELSRFGEDDVHWQHENSPHGLGCHRGGYRDVAMRTVDMRDPSWSAGHHHPKRFRLYTPVPEGFIRTDANTVPASVLTALSQPMEKPNSADVWSKVSRNDDDYKLYLVRRRNLVTVAGGRNYVRIEERLLPRDATIDDNDSPKLRIRSTLLTLPVQGIGTSEDISDWFPGWRGNEHLVVAVTGRQPEVASADATSIAREPFFSEQDWDTHWHKNGFLLQWERHHENGVWHTSLRGGTWDAPGERPGMAGTPVASRGHLRHSDRWPFLEGDIDVARPVADKEHHVDLRQMIVGGRLRLHADKVNASTIAARQVSLNPLTADVSHLAAADSLLHELSDTPGSIELEYCTVSEAIDCKELRASDCTLLGALTHDEVPRLRLRYSCAPRLGADPPTNEWVIHRASLVRRWPDLHHEELTETNTRRLDGAKFGQRGFGVLKRAVHASIRYGAEDGGELGAFHHRHYCGRQDAVEQKLMDFLPVGTLPALIVDENWVPPIARRRGESQ